MKSFVRGFAVVCAAAVSAVALAATPPLTKAQYVAKLRAANTASAKVDNAAGAAAGSRTATPMHVQALLWAMGRRHVEIGHVFAALTPPTGGVKPNDDFAKAEVVFGQQNEVIAAKLPTESRAVMLKYLQSLKPPSGGKMLDRAIAELHAAGFKI